MTKVFNKNKVGHIIAKGAHYEVRKYERDKVIKIPLPRADRYPGPLQSRKHYFLLKCYLNDYLPRTEFIADKRYRQPLIIQERIRGRPLRNIDWNEIKKSRRLHRHLLKLIKGIIKLEERTGKTVEMFGRGKWWQGNYPKNTGNVIVDKKGKPFLVDVFLLDPKETNLKWWELRRRLFLWFLRRSLKSMKKDLESLSS